MSLPTHAGLLFDLLRWGGPRAGGAPTPEQPAGVGGAPTPEQPVGAGGALTPEQWAGVADLAVAQQVAPLLYQRMGERGLLGLAPAPTVERLAGLHRANAVRTLRIYADLAQIAAIAAALGVPLVALKGVALAAPLYKNVALRAIGDIDLLAPAAQAAALGAALEAAGYRPVSSAGLSASLAQHLPTLERAGAACPVEIHWRLSTDEDHYTLPVGEIWGELEPLELPGCRMGGMGAEALLLYLSIHATYHHELIGVGVRPLCDLAQLLTVRGAALSWPAVAERARRWRCGRGLALALRLAHDLVGAPVPEDALALCGAAELPAALLGAAREQLFSHYRDGRAMPAALASLADGAGPAAGLATLWRRIFVSREALATQFGLRPRDPRLGLFYGVRLWTLLRRHAGAAAALAGGDEESRRSAARRGAIGGWLAGG